MSQIKLGATCFHVAEGGVRGVYSYVCLYLGEGEL
jgi:hypothetical protein